MNRPVLILLIIFLSGAWVIYYFLQPNTPTPIQSVPPNLNLAPDIAKSKIDSGTSQIVNETNLDIKMDLSSVVLKLVIGIQKKFPYGVNYHDRTVGLQYVSEPELIVFLLGGFFVKCERWGNLRDHGLEGYFLRDYMHKAGIIRCPEVLSILYPLLMAEQKLEEQDGLTHDEYGDQMDVIQEKMKQMELNAKPEEFEEIYKLLLIFSRKHGITE